jgi:hypothetical protein
MRPLSSAALVAVAAGLLVSGCGRNKHKIELNHRFSVNVAEAPVDFPPSLESLTPAQTRAFMTHGAPTFFRFWWTPDGEFLRGRDVQNLYSPALSHMGKDDQLKDVLSTRKASWIYLRNRDEQIVAEGDREIIFNDDGVTFDERPLSPQLKLISVLGDPDERHPPKNDERGRLRETWVWEDRGRTVQMIDGVIARLDRFNGTGPGTKIKY